MERFTSSGVEIVIPNGNENYLNQPSDSIFNQNNLPILEINLPENAIAYIDADPAAEEYVEGSLTYNGETISPIGIRYKGSIGAFVGGVSGNDWSNPSGSKTATKLSMKFKIDWKGYHSAFYDLKTLQLHSMSLDNSQMHDRLGYWLFRQMGVPAPRCIHAKLYINGEFNGLFALVEQIDEQFAKYHFSDGSGNLYKEVWPLKSNNSIQTDRKFYEGLVSNRQTGVNINIIKSFAQNITNANDSEIQTILNNHINIEQTVALAVVDRAIRNDDGPFHWYCGWFGCEPHNFFWYENPSTNKVHLIPWDLDNAFENIITNTNPVTPIADIWGDTTNSCQPFEYGAWGMYQKSAACDRIIGGLARYDSKYQQLKETLINGSMSEQTVNPIIDEWANQIRNATIKADQEHNDALKLSNWEEAVVDLKTQLDHARNN
ncbi:MAG: CotH kinase family protein [Flavobacteriales bacterium]|nr:CotH kinase family protein [Flavobacteriales bacterium]